MECDLFDHNSMLGSDISTRLFEAARRTGKPCSGGIEVTAKCNLRCVHCYNESNAASPELALENVLQIIDQLVDAEILGLLLTGGEPLARKDFPTIYKYVRQKGIVAIVFTNGTLVTDEIGRLFQEHTPLDVEVSVYGAHRDTYERFTGVRGSYEKCLSGLECLLKYDVPVTVKAILTKANFDEWRAIERLADELGAKFRYSMNLFPRLDGRQDVLDLRLSPDQVLELDFGDQRRRVGLTNLLDEMEPPSDRDMEFLYLCGAALTTFHIDHRGYLCACVRERDHAVNLTEVSFSEAFDSLSRAVRRKKVRPEHRCRGCKYVLTCDQCPAAARLETGTSDGISEYICHIGQQRGRILNGG